MEMEQHILESGQVLQTHPRGACMGTWCCIHTQMPGPWESWPRSWREDRGIMERICPLHGIGHPVAEMYEPAIALGREILLVHGCCSCPCAPSDLPQWGTQTGLTADVQESEPVNPIFKRLGEEVDDLLIDFATNCSDLLDPHMYERLKEFLMTVRKLTKE